MLTRNSSVAEKASRLKVLGSIAQNDCSSHFRDSDSATPLSHQISLLDEKLRPIEQQLHYFLNQADDLQNHVVKRLDDSRGEGLVHVVPTFLHTCQPYFTYLESTARSTVPQRTPLPIYIRSRLLNFSKQLCARLEQLVLSYANYKILSLDEAAPNSYFLCYEEVPGKPPEGEGEVQTVAKDRMWSIGQWVQTYPDPENIDDWVLCEVPQAQYHKLLSLGGEEPSTCSATDCLLGALLCQQGPMASKAPGHSQ
ncbi:UPF0575 protein C19orf67 homolog [Aplochiton taeniatus]